MNDLQFNRRECRLRWEAERYFWRIFRRLAAGHLFKESLHKEADSARQGMRRYAQARLDSMKTMEAA